MDFYSQIAQTKAGVERASQALLKTFAAVPDDKLGWSPSETSRSSLWIVGHCGRANEAFARGMRGEPFPSLSPKEFATMVWNVGRDTASRDEAVRRVET